MDLNIENQSPKDLGNLVIPELKAKKLVDIIDGFSLSVGFNMVVW